MPMKKLTRLKSAGYVLVSFMAILLGGCASTSGAIDILEKIHRPPEGEVSISRSTESIHRYNKAIEIDSISLEIEDPVSFCRDQVKILRHAGYSSLDERGKGVAVLCYVAVRSPSALVRADALRALGSLCAFSTSAIDKSDSSLDFDEIIRRLRSGSSETGGNVEPLIAHAFYITAANALFERTELVPPVAVDALFLFDMAHLRLPVAELMERSPNLRLRIHLLKKLGEKGFETEDLNERLRSLGDKLVIQITESLDFSDPGVVYHAVELLKHVTQIDNSDPGFWRAWWREYLPKHADELTG